MIVKLAGLIDSHEGTLTVVMCGGVGYGVHTLLDDQAGFRIGEKAELFIYEHIKEDAYDLYGFSSHTRKDLFVKLLSVNGVGPKAALAICNLASEVQVRTAIAAGDTSFISRASGVGKKVAERVVVDLKNKVGLVAMDTATAFLHGNQVREADEALQALISLGYSHDDAVAALANTDSSLPTAERIKQALKR